MLPSTFMALPREERAFVIAAIKVRVENEEKEAKKLKRK